MADNPDTNQNPSLADALRSDKAQLNAEMADALTRLYWQRRIEYQLTYYRKKVREFEDNVDNAFRLGAILMTVASLLAALGVIVESQPGLSALLALATAVIPALASYITAFRQLYNWDRQLTIYRDTQLSLEGAKLLMPDLEALTLDEAHKLFPQLVQQVEGVIEKEAAQWGQIAIGKDEEKGEATEEFGELYAAALADSSGNVDQEKLGALSNILESPGSAPTPGQYRLSPDELETESPLLPDNLGGSSHDEARQRRDLAMAAAQTSTQQVVSVDENSYEAPSLPVTAESEPNVMSPQATDSQMPASTVDTASPVLDDETRALVDTGDSSSPELSEEMRALVDTGDTSSASSPELSEEMRALVDTGNTSSDDPTSVG